MTFYVDSTTVSLIGMIQICALRLLNMHAIFFGKLLIIDTHARNVEKL